LDKILKIHKLQNYKREKNFTFLTLAIVIGWSID